jgi:hypothetical protein
MVSYLQLLSLCKLWIAKVRETSAYNIFMTQKNLLPNTYGQRRLKAVEMVALVAVIAEQHVFTVALAPANSATSVEGRFGPKDAVF